MSCPIRAQNIPFIGNDLTLSLFLMVREERFFRPRNRRKWGMGNVANVIVLPIINVANYQF